jgi:hypothetical protein
MQAKANSTALTNHWNAQLYARNGRPNVRSFILESTRLNGDSSPSLSGRPYDLISLFGAQIAQLFTSTEC